MVSIAAGPWNGHQAGINQSAGELQQKSARRQRKHTKKTKPSNQAVARIARSTAELSANIKYISYVIAYSAVGSREEGKDIRESARRRSGKTSPADSTMHLKRSKKAKAAEESDGLVGVPAAGARKTKGTLRPTPPSEYPADKWAGNEMYPLSDGFLRDEYVEHLVERCNQPNNEAEGWCLERIGTLFQDHVARQRRHVYDGERDWVKIFVAAVELHERMVADPRVRKTRKPHKRGKPFEEMTREERWRDVADELAPAVFMAKSYLKPVIAEDTYEEFLYQWSEVVKELRWNDKPMPKMWQVSG